MKTVDAFLEDHISSLTFLTMKQILEAYDYYVRGDLEECKKYIKNKLGY